MVKLFLPFSVDKLVSSLFTTVMDNMTEEDIKDESYWCIRDKDGPILVSRTRNLVNCMLELWKKNLDSNVSKINRSKAEYMKCKFIGFESRESVG